MDGFAAAVRYANWHGWGAALFRAAASCLYVLEETIRLRRLARVCESVILMYIVGQSKMPPNDYRRQWRRYKRFKKLRFY
jgi:hypothetical protein